MKHRAVILFITFATVIATVVHCNSDTPPPGDDDSGVPGITCSKLLFCDQGCTDQTCTDGCYAQGTGVAQGLFNAMNDCIAAQCPNGDSACQQTAATGACGAYLSSCFSDTFAGPADPDGGGVVVPDAGASYNCGALNTCLATCGAGDAACATACNAKATPQAEALESALQSCLDVACPKTDGGPCATSGPACAGCIEQVTLAQPNTCADPYVACNSDTSNTDGGTPVPTSLVDGGVITNVLAGLDQAASTIVARNGWLYFTQVIENGPVYRLRVGASGLAFGDGGISDDAGAVLESVGPPQPTPVSLAVDDANVYVWSVGTFKLASSVNNQDGTVVQLPISGGNATTLATNVEAFYDSGYLNAIAVDANHVYWVSGAVGNDGAIMRAPIGGGAATAIFTGQALPQAIATDGTNVYWASWGTFDSQGRSNNDGTLWQGSVNGGNAIQLASKLSGPSTIVIDATNVYWVNLGPLGTNNFPALNSGSVMRAPIGGGTVATLASTQSVPFSIAMANGTLYWSDYGLSGPGLIMSVPSAGGAIVPLATGLDDPSALAISGSTLYFTIANSSPNAGAILSLSPF